MTHLQALFPPLDDEEGDSSNEQQIYSLLETLKKQKSPRQENLAVNAAVLIQQEIQRWQNSIRELESRLGDQDESMPAFPNLPVVVDDDGEEMDDGEEDFEDDGSDDGSFTFFMTPDEAVTALEVEEMEVERD